LFRVVISSFYNFNLQEFNESQRAHISTATMGVLYNVKEEQQHRPDNIKQEPGLEPEPPGV
jgi:hypothetical protein